MTNRSIIFVPILLVLLAAGLRFYQLGTWSFGFDELYTTMETYLYWEGKPVPKFMHSGEELDKEKSQFYRLPKLIPIPYFVSWIGYKTFGDDEFGSRVMPAVIGSLNVGIIFLLVRPVMGFPASLVLSMMILFWPDHVLNSQNNRFSAMAFFFISIALLLGAHIAVRRSLAAAIALGPIGILLALTHVFGGIVWGTLLTACLVDYWTTRKSSDVPSRFPWGIGAVLCGWSIILLMIAVFHIVPIASSWNAFVTWGCSPLNALISFVAHIGWPVFVLGIPAFCLLASRIREPGHGYWICCFLCSLSTIAVLPLKIVFYPHYTFFFAFPAFVILALFAGYVHRFFHTESFAPWQKLLGAAWLLVFPCLNLPMLGDYYLDGGRYDTRSAYRFINENWEPGDRLACFERFMAYHYAPNCEPRIAMTKPDMDQSLQRIIDDNVGGTGRLWIFVVHDRHEPDDPLRRCLSRNSQFIAHFGKSRFNFFVRDIDIYRTPAR